MDEQREGHWLNRAVWGMALTSFFSDLGHEAATALLPAFLAALGLPPAALGAVEGIADAASSFVKLGAGWISDRLGRRKALVVAGYAATGLGSGLMAMADGAGLLIGGKLFGWVGRGGRGPLRDAILTDSIPAEARGRAFGFHRAGDTIGAILGPLGAVALLGWLGRRGLAPLPALRLALWITVLPGLAAAVCFAWMVKERARTKPKLLSFRHALAKLGAPFRRYLGSVGLFGLGDFAHSLLILASMQLLAPALGAARAALAAGLLYVMHNLVYALAAYPSGALADRLGHRRVLAFGYLAAALVPLGLILAFRAGGAGLPTMAALMGLAGFAGGVQDTLEGSATADLVPAEHRGLGFGLLGAVNGVGDLVSSLLVGGLWTLHPAWGFGYAAALMLAGGIALAMQAPGS